MSGNNSMPTWVTIPGCFKSEVECYLAHRVLLMGGLLALLVSQASLQHLCLLHQGSSQLVAQTGILTTSLLGQSVTYSKPSSMYLYIEHERTAWRC